MSSSTYSLRYYHQSKKLILAFRGLNFFNPRSMNATFNTKWIRPKWINHKRDPNSEVFVFKGLNQLFLEVIEDPENLLQLITQAIHTLHPSQLLLSGHSQGSGLMTYFAPYLAEYLLKQNIQIPLGMIIFACPRSGNLAFRQYISSYSFQPFFNITLHGDPVAFTPVSLKEYQLFRPPFCKAPVNCLVYMVLHTSDEHFPCHAVSPLYAYTPPQPKARLTSQAQPRLQSDPHRPLLFFSEYTYLHSLALSSMHRSVYIKSCPVLLVQKHLHPNIASVIRPHFDPQKFSIVPSSIRKKRIQFSRYMMFMASLWIVYANKQYWILHKYSANFFKSVVILNFFYRANSLAQLGLLSHSSNLSLQPVVSLFQIDLLSLSLIASLFHLPFSSLDFDSIYLIQTALFTASLVFTGLLSPSLFIFHFVLSVIYSAVHEWVENILNLEKWHLQFLSALFVSLYYFDQIVFFYHFIPLPTGLTLIGSMIWGIISLFSHFFESEDNFFDPHEADPLHLNDDLMSSSPLHQDFLKDDLKTPFLQTFSPLAPSSTHPLQLSLSQSA